MGYMIESNEGIVCFEEETPVNVVRWRVPVEEFLRKTGENPSIVPDNSHPPFTHKVNGTMWATMIETAEEKPETPVVKKTRRKKVEK